MNKLGAEKSPYLKQHQHNPVAWRPWGPEAFQEAKAANKPIFLSIGYSTCYWCHVMEKDSFEQHDVADALNRDFIAIKVDREEHPDVDEVYMDAVLAMTGRGGWPMSVFLAPDLKPFWGGTYFPRAQFLQILSQLAQVWRESPEKLTANCQKLLEHLEQRPPSVADAESLEKVLEKAAGQCLSRYDKHYGGFSGAPKFPPTMALRLLLRLQGRDSSAQLRHMVLGTLDAMAAGGIYDHLGGGFHRYSVDERWLVPHFEKMLYDNALLATTYVEAYQSLGVPHYADVARETLDYVLREMTHAAGAFFAAQDAGEVGKEGEFYVWTWKELEETLGENDFKKLRAVFPLTQAGNFEHGTNVLHLANIAEWRERSQCKELMDKLLSTRTKRIAPLRDEKILTAWNGLMIGAMARAGRVLGEERYIVAAEKAAAFIQRELWQEGKLLRRWIDGEAKYEATAADYAYLIQGLIELYQTNFQSAHLAWALELQKTQVRDFWDEARQAFSTGAKQEEHLFFRKFDLADGALPPSNGVSAENLAKLYHYSFSEDWQKILQALYKEAQGEVARIPMGYTQLLSAMEFAQAPVKEVVLVGPETSADFQKGLRALQTAFLPHVVMATVSETRAGLDLPVFFGKTFKSGEPTKVYICEKGACQKPLSVDEALAVLLPKEETTEEDD